MFARKLHQSGVFRCASLCRMHPQGGRELMEKELQVVMRDAASLRRDITRMGLTNCQKKALESSAVFQETELGSFVQESEAAGLDTALLAQVQNKQTGET